MLKLCHLFILAYCAIAVQSQECKEVTTVENFDINAYASAKWYVHQQAKTAYLPESRNYCVTAEYTVKEKTTPVFGYKVGVHNSDADANGNVWDGNLCAASDPDTPSKLKVAPCFLPQALAGPYWVVAYNETQGYALVSGGQPTEVGENGGCTTGSGVNNSGLWIFSRSQHRDEGLIDDVRTIATDAGFDISVLNDVDQTNCNEQDEATFSIYGIPSYLRVPLN